MGGVLYKKIIIINNALLIDKSLFKGFSDAINLEFIETETYEVDELKEIIATN